MRELGEARDGPGFGGSPVADEHLYLTLFWLGYDGPQTSALAAQTCAAADPIAGTATYLVLIRSMPRPFRHEERGRWPLGAAPSS